MMMGIKKFFQFAADLLTGEPRSITDRVRVVKAVLWFFTGVAATVAVARFVHGLGATTSLTDVTPWGLWIGFDVVGGVALAAGGFVIAATVYIFHLHNYHAIVRSAVLTAFLGYAAVIVGLLFDLGLPWNIWRPTVYWQHHSALFEVAWCVMLYFTVLALEFAPVVLEKMPFPRLFRFIKKLALPLVILGIMLSTLHQSSLGTLFLVMPYRLNPLWYSPIQPLLFFVSAVGLGLGMVTLESLITSWLYRREPEWPLLRGLAKAASIVLFLYAAFRLIDLTAQGKLALLATPGWDTVLFWIEILISSLIPATLFALPKTRASKTGTWLGAGMIVLGFVLNRIAVSGLATITITGTNYSPAWTEFALSLGVVAAAALVFFFFVERFSVYEGREEPVTSDVHAPKADPVSGVRLSSPWAGASALYSLVFIVAVGLAFGLLPRDAVEGAKPLRTPVAHARVISAIKFTPPGQPFAALALPLDKGSMPGESKQVLMIDGNEDGRFVLFDHAAHQERNGGTHSCGICHHLNRPYDEASSCSQCHRDMYLGTDIFDHELHVRKLGGNPACRVCHQDPDAPKSRETTKPCLSCHQGMVASGSSVTLTGSPPFLPSAVGYMQAMHGMCIECHKETLARRPELSENFVRCAACHRESDDQYLRRMAPYVESK